MATILTACGDSPMGLRDRALIVLAYRAGLKQKEALGARVEEVEHEHSRLRIIADDRVRTVGLDPWTLGVIDRWLAVRTELGGGASGFILCSFASRVTQRVKAESSMNIGRFRVRQQERAEAMGLTPEYLHFSTLRNTLFAELVEEGLPLNVIQAHLGLETLQAAQHYLHRMDIPPPNSVQVLARRRSTP